MTSWRGVGASVWFALLTACAAAAPGADAPGRRDVAGEWPAYGGAAANRFSPLAEIDRGNVTRLAPAWTYHTGAGVGAAQPEMSFEATPIVLDGTMYLSTPAGQVIALVPETGAVRWRYDAHVDIHAGFGDFANRGVSAWTDASAGTGVACRRRIFAATVDARLTALDAATGRPCEGFGARGVVDLKHGLRNAPDDGSEYEETSPPAVVNGVVVVGSGVSDNNRTEAASGEVRGFDARTGALRWTWDPVPQDSTDPAYATWRGPRAHHTGAANAWSVITADTARGLVFVPTGSPSVDYWGGTRLGDNRYANSITALRASSGRVVWSFQTVHHDLWDYDNAAPPLLVTLHRDGRDVAAVLQATKTGMLYVLDRDTGKPIVPVEERPVPASDVPGEVASATQPFSTLPPLGLHTLNRDSLFGLTPEDLAACRATMRRMRYDGIFTPPSTRGTIVLPSNVGGVAWGGVAFDPARQIAVMPVSRIAAEIELLDSTKADLAALRSRPARIAEQYVHMQGTPYVLHRALFVSPHNIPCTPPPFGAMVALDLRSGKKLWEVPLGDMAGLAPEGKGDALRGLGSVVLGGPMATAGGLVFIAGTVDRRIRALDIETGRELWSAPLPAGGRASPMTYRGADGRQYVAIAAGGGGPFGRGDALVTFALPAAAGARP